MTSSQATALGYALLLLSNQVFQCLGRAADLQLDLDRGHVYGSHPYLKLLDKPELSRKVPCSGQAILRLDFSGPYKRAKIELFYGSEPKSWTFLLSDSKAAYGFGADHKYTSNCASMQVFNRQLRVYSNVLANYRRQSLNGQTLMDVVDDAVYRGTNMTVEASDEMLAWKTTGTNWTDGDKIHSPYLFTLSGQRTEFGPSEYFLYAAFNRVPLGAFHNGSGLCHVRVTFKRKQDGVCDRVRQTCHRDAVCRQTDAGHRCVCKPGFVGNGIHSCRDLDECQVNKGDCQQRCHNLQGSYYCSCRQGYTLLPNGRDCTATQPGSSLFSKRIRLRFHVAVGKCKGGQKREAMFMNELKRKLLSHQICKFPCTIHGLASKCKSRYRLTANFEFKLDGSVISTSRYCNENCLRCQVEKRLQNFIADLRSLLFSEKFNVSLRSQVYTTNGRSLKVPRVRNACTQGRRRKNKRVAGCHAGTYFDMFEQRCVNCSRGSYQPHRSESFCFRCPGNTTTPFSGAREQSECQRTQCGGNLTAMSGVITSPNYPDAYPRDLECTWTIYPRKHRNILLLIPRISLPTTPDCSDYLSMRGSADPLSVYTYHACESFDQPIAFVSRSKNLHITFRSRNDGGPQVAEGFKIFYVKFDERFKSIVKHIVEDGELYANKTNRKLLQDETLVRQILDVIVDPSDPYVSSNRLQHKVPGNLLRFIEQKVIEFFNDISPYRKRRSISTRRHT